MTMVRAQSKHVEVNGVRLRYLDWGTASLTPLICLHGHTGQAHIWDEFAQAMAPHFHVLAVDQRGHGESQWAADGYDRDKFVADLAAFVEALDLSRFVLCGLSMGGWNSLLYARDHPDRVERIVIVDIAPESSEESRRQFGRRPATPTEFGSFEEVVAWRRQGDPWAADERLSRDAADLVRPLPDGRWVWKHDPALFTSLRDGQDQGLIDRYWKAMEEIPCPILEVRGKESPLVSDEILERMKTVAVDFGWVDVPGAGHVVTVDKPHEFIRVTAPFLGVEL